MNILVLAHNRAHARHYSEGFYSSEETNFIYAFDAEQLFGLRPDAIIELPEWWLGKTDIFMATIKHLKQKFKMRNPKV